MGSPKVLVVLAALGLAATAGAASSMGCGGGSASRAGGSGEANATGSSSGSGGAGGGNGSSGETSTAGESGEASTAGSSGETSTAGSSGTASTAGAAGVGGVPGGVAGPGATLQGCMIFPADNPWNVAIDGPGVQVIHDYDAKLPPNTSLHPDWGDFSTNHYGIPFNVVNATQPDLATTFNSYASESDPGPGGWVGMDPVTAGSAMGNTTYPFFVGMKIEGDPGPGGTPGNLPGDQHAIVLQQGASGCRAYEAWNCVAVTAPPFECANGAVFNLDSNALRPLGWTSADAAGLSVLAGLVKLAEVRAGAVNHAIRVTFNTTQKTYILPATHAASSDGNPYPPMGLRLRLKASVSTSSYTAASQIIMAALKKYGFIVADNGSDWYFQGDSDDGWDAMAPDGKDTLIDEISSDFRNLTGSDFEAIYSGMPITTGL
jgi:hypothetical protein